MLIFGGEFFFCDGTDAGFGSRREGSQLAAEEIIVNLGFELEYESPGSCRVIPYGKGKRGHAALPGAPVADKLKESDGNFSVDAGLASGVFSASDKGQCLSDEGLHIIRKLFVKRENSVSVEQMLRRVRGSIHGLLLVQAVRFRFAERIKDMSRGGEQGMPLGSV